MAIKMKILHYPEKGKIATFTNALAEELELKADKIPPAYECSRDRLLFAGITAGKSLDDALARFLRGLTRDKVQYVAIYTDAPDSSIEAMKELITAGGASVIDVKKVKGSMFAFLTGAKPEEIDELKAWAKEVLEKLPE
ncbi:MAG: hypothetical protein IJX27_02880 [Clostridia bacterium]|nr:hypothetical protein [Clostridia bacterium]